MVELRYAVVFYEHVITLAFVVRRLVIDELFRRTGFSKYMVGEPHTSHNLSVGLIGLLIMGIGKLV